MHFTTSIRTYNPTLPSSHHFSKNPKTSYACCLNFTLILCWHFLQAQVFFSCCLIFMLKWLAIRKVGKPEHHNLLIGPVPHFTLSHQKTLTSNGYHNPNKNRKENWRKWWIKSHKCTDAFHCSMKRVSGLVRKIRSKEIHASAKTKKGEKDRVAEQQ